MLVRHVAIVSETKKISSSALMRVSAALSKQATRDFEPIWNIKTNVHSFARLQDVPLGYWPVIIRDDIPDPNAAGYHTDRNGSPFALVRYDAGWSLTTSHEVLEMLCDPFGNRTIAGPSLKTGQGRVEYLVEVCDPCEDAPFGYTVNNVLVSDFYTPHFFDPVKAADVRYSFSGKITEPRQVLENGYISWYDPVSGEWWQLTLFGTKQINKLGKADTSFGSVREWIDAQTPTPLETRGGLKASQAVTASATTATQAAKSSTASARALRQHIKRIIAKR
jgi:hypothetical protein